MLSTDLVLSGPPFVHVPLFDRLVPARDTGFAGLTLTPGDIWTLEKEGVLVAEIRERIEDHGLAIKEVDCIAAWLPSQRTQTDGSPLASLLRSLTPERVIEKAARIGAPSVTIVEMQGASPSRDEAAEAFAAVCDIAGEHGLNVDLEFLPFGGIPDLASAWAIVEAADRPNGGLTLDSWHFFRSGSSFELLRALPGQRIHTVQINDAHALPADDLMHETMNARLLPGARSFDLVRLIQTLDTNGCEAPVSVEVFSADIANRPMADAIQGWADAAHTIIAQARNPT